MRSEKEKKSITKSIKLSPLQVQQIEEKAKEKNLTFSSYMVDCAVHGSYFSCGDTEVNKPSRSCAFCRSSSFRIYSVLSILSAISNTIFTSSCIRTAICGVMLLFNLEQKMGLFVEGGLDLWESLK